jgi:hypothetical protein
MKDELDELLQKYKKACTEMNIQEIKKIHKIFNKLGIIRLIRYEDFEDDDINTD